MRTTLLGIALILVPALAAQDAVPPEGHRLMVDGGAINSLAFAPDGKTIAAASSEGKVIRIWALPSGAERGFTVKTAMAVACSPDGKLIAVAGALTPRVSLHDAASGRIKAILESEGDRPIRALAFSRDGRLLA